MFSLRSHRLSALAAAALIPAALVTAPPSVAGPGPDEAVAPIVDAAAPCCLESLPVAELPPGELPEALPAPEALPDGLPAPDALPEALPVPEALPAPEALPVPEAHVEPASRTLGPGIGSEEGLQIKTVLAERSVSALFPAVHSIIGVRPDAKPWHPSGRAIDVMIPNPGSPEGIALGNAIRDFALANAGPLGLQDVIWQGTYYTPAGPSGSGYGHYDHVHITTIGGGYASGGEEYLLP